MIGARTTYAAPSRAAALNSATGLAACRRASSDVAVLGSLHLVEHVREGGLELQRLLNLVGTHIGIFAVFEEARAVVVADELDESLRPGLPANAV